MKKVTIIIGNQESGKTTKARELTKAKKTVWLDSIKLDNPFLYQSVTPETEVIAWRDLASKIAANVD